MPQRTTEGKWVLWEQSTGRRFESWPVDARGMLASGYAVDVEPVVEPGEMPVEVAVLDFSAPPKRRGRPPKAKPEDEAQPAQAAE